ncbi:MFS transporter [Brevibacillus choshinensis]|uniref:MFS transporter n=1 Tax=Brevibacillus choshinensis TaxID=54911 RepID=A0ABX7FQB0_BRECH|nr:MFS transporter [Brevibacillus choshinensis]QRG68433.1 MFS transporter [Brevibacillus choshinensis]
MLRENKTFRILFFSYGLSTLGDWFDFIAVSIMLAFVWKADPMTMALLPIAYAAPGIALGQFAGVLADRVNKVRMMMIMAVIQAGATFLLLAMPDPLSFLLVIALRSCASVFNDPAQQTLTRQIVPEHQLLQATSLNGAVFQMGKLIGPLIGGAVAAFVAPAICLIVNACSFFLSALLLLSIRHAEKSIASSPVRSQKKSVPLHLAWREGWGIFLQNRILLFSTIFSLLAMMAIQLADAQLTIIFREKVPLHPEMVGYVVSAIGLGALLTVTWLHRQKEIRSYGWILGGGVFLIGICFSWIALHQPESNRYWLLAAALFAGVGTGLTTVGTNYLVQKETPREALGRVRGIIDSLTSATFIIAPLLGGWLMTVWGPSLAFLRVGAGIAAIGLGALFLQRVVWGKRKVEATVVSEQAG